MRNFLLLSLFICLLWKTTARPPRLDDDNDGDSEEAEYASNDDTGSEESMQEDGNVNINDQESSDGDRDQNSVDRQPLLMFKGKNMQHINSNDRTEDTNNDNLMEYAHTRNLGDELQSDNEGSHNRKQTRYLEQNENNIEHFSNNYRRNSNGPIEERVNEIDKRTADSIESQNTPEDSDNIFVTEREHRNEYNSIDKNYKQYYNQMQLNRRNSKVFEPSDFMNRDRRQADQIETLTSTEKNSSPSNKMNEEDETAIKRHIKKLSGDELEELLNSLSPDKKALLNKIIESTQNGDNLNKREITKKDGASEENNYIDGNIAELNKDQGLSSCGDINTESVVSQGLDTGNQKQEGQMENNDLNSDTKSPDGTQVPTIENKSELTESADETTNNIKLDVSLNTNEEKNVAESNKQSLKTEIKRETNKNYLDDDSLNEPHLSNNNLNGNKFDDHLIEPDHDCISQGEDFSQLIDEESRFHSDKAYKREAFLENQENFEDSYRSLEESFPNNHCEDTGQYLDSNMPHVRVKRKEELALRKRAAGVMPDTKVAYFPYKAENDDEDNDEGSEFDDDAFYDRTSNLAKSNANNPDEVIYQDKNIKRQEDQLKIIYPSTNEKIESNAESLGSDTDSVLSGVEGVDENLMFNSGSRNRRTLDKTIEDPVPKGPFSSSTNVKLADTYNNLPNYQENDSFGALPRNYDSDLGRYKRIRRVKPPATEIASATIDI